MCLPKGRIEVGKIKLSLLEVIATAVSQILPPPLCFYSIQSQ